MLSKGGSLNNEGPPSQSHVERPKKRKNRRSFDQLTITFLFGIYTRVNLGFNIKVLLLKRHSCHEHFKTFSFYFSILDHFTHLANPA